MSYKRDKTRSTSSQPYATPKVLFCRGCQRPCRTQSALDSHQRICEQLKLGKHDSFFKLDPLRSGPPSCEVPAALQNLMAPKDTTEKVLPLSQSPTTVQPETLPPNLQPFVTPSATAVPLSTTSTGCSQTAGQGASTADTTNHRTSTFQTVDSTQQQNANDKANCPICKVDVADENSVECESCKVWVHQKCLHMSDEEFQSLDIDKSIQWFCARCRQIKANNIKWGNHTGEENIRRLISSTYETIIEWRKNTFRLPRGKCGIDFIKELTRLINLFVDKTQWERLAIPLVHIFIPIMLQLPSPKSKPREHSKYLASRLEKWKNGDMRSLMDENNEIQKRLKSRKNGGDKGDQKQKSFVKLMLLGKIGDAAKKINNEDSIKGVHDLDEEIKNILQQKHPPSKDPAEHIILPQTSARPQPVMYEEITADFVYRTAKRMKGSGGPTLIDSDAWKQFLCSKANGKAGTDLCQAVADMTKILCTVDVHHDCLTEFIAGRLVPLDKGMTKDGTPGVRPVGVGEVLRRLVGKLLIGVIKEDITTAAGPLQTCTGIKAGIEAAIHAMRKVFEEEETQAVLLVDAENAFNKLNRKAALNNIKELCPPFHQYLLNTYQAPAQLIIPGKDDEKCSIILSEEGCTQGDVAAMGNME